MQKCDLIRVVLVLGSEKIIILVRKSVLIYQRACVYQLCRQGVPRLQEVLQRAEMYKATTSKF